MKEPALEGILRRCVFLWIIVFTVILWRISKIGSLAISRLTAFIFNYDMLLFWPSSIFFTYSLYSYLKHLLNLFFCHKTFYFATSGNNKSVIMIKRGSWPISYSSYSHSVLSSDIIFIYCLIVSSMFSLHLTWNKRKWQVIKYLIFRRGAITAVGMCPALMFKVFSVPCWE